MRDKNRRSKLSYASVVVFETLDVYSKGHLFPYPK